MKKLLFISLFTCSFLAGFSQVKISDFPLLLGRGDSMSVPVLVPNGLNFTNRRMYGKDLAYGKVDSIVISNDSIYEINKAKKIFRGIIKGGIANFQDSLANYGFYTYSPIHIADGGNKQDSIYIDTASATKGGILLSADYNKLQTAYGWGNHATAGYLLNGYASITDGSNTATATGATGLKVRTGNPILSIVVTNNDPTHGDNLLFTVNTANITLPESQVTNLSTDLNSKAPLASPVFTGIPSGPTAANGTNTTQLATTAYVQNALSLIGGGTVTNVSSGNAGTLFTTSVSNPSSTPSIAYSLNSAAAHSFWGNNTGASTAPGYVSLTTADLPSLPESQITNLTTDLSAKAPLASPSFSGTPTAPTPAVGTNNTQIATTAFVQSSMASAGAGTVSNVSVGNVTGFMVSTVTNPSTTPSVTYALSNATAHSFWGNNTGTAGTPSYVSFTAADIPNLPESQITNLTTDLNAKAPLASPAFTGLPTAPTAGSTTNNTQVATTAFVQSVKGEVNTASNVTATNTQYANVFYQKAGVDLQFHPISTPVSKGISVSNTGNDVVISNNAYDYYDKLLWTTPAVSGTQTSAEIPVQDNTTGEVELHLEGWDNSNGHTFAAFKWYHYEKKSGTITVLNTYTIASDGSLITDGLSYGLVGNASNNLVVGSNNVAHSISMKAIIKINITAASN